MAQQNTAAGEETSSRSMCYGRTTGVYTAAAEAFYVSILQSAKSLKPGAISDQFLRHFLTAADTFCSTASQSLATVLKEFSMQREVREAQEPVLARLVRNRCFERLDALLIDYAQLLIAMGLDIRSAHAQLAESRVRDDLGALLGLKGAGVPVPAEGGKRMSPLKAKESAAMRVLDFLVALDGSPREVLDYVSSKAFTGDPDFAQQSGFVLNITESLREQRDEVVGLVENFEIIKQKKWDEQRAAEFALIREAARNSLMKTADRRTGFGSLAIGLFCGLLDWGAFALGVNNQYVIIAAIVVGAVGIFFLYRGIMQLVRI